MQLVKVVKDISLYDVLLNPTESDLLSTEDLLQIEKLLCHPDLLTRFLIYGYTLRIMLQRPEPLTLAEQIQATPLGRGSRSCLRS